MSVEFILVGALTGAISGILGIGGGAVAVPILVFLFGFSQTKAQGTTLAMLVPPIGALAAYVYYEKGFVDLPVAAFLCMGFIIGSYFGAKFAIGLGHDTLGKIFGFALLIIGAKMILA